MLNIYERTEKDRSELTKTIEKILAYAKKKGADEAAVAISKKTGISTKVRNQDVEKLTFSKDRSIGITVYCNKCSGSVATTDISDESLYNAVDAAIAISKHTQYDEYSGLPDESDLYKDNIDLDMFHPQEPDPDFCINRALELEKLTIGKPFIKQTVASSFSSKYGLTVIGNSLGQIISIPTSAFSSSLTTIGEKDGNMETGSGYHLSCDLNDLWSNEKIANEAIEDTTSRLGAIKINTMTAPIIFDKLVSPSLFGVLAAGLSGRSQFKKTSFITGCLEQQLFPSWINVYEDPFIKKNIHSAPFDSDGSKTIAKPIVENGIIKTYLLSSYSARQLKMKNTGNAGGTYNWIISNSNISQKDLLKEMGTGLLVKDTIGSHIDRTTGDFSFGVSGDWIENGEVAYPVHEITIAGNIKDVFKNIVKIANDPDPRVGKQVGSMFIGELKIAGN